MFPANRKIDVTLGFFEIFDELHKEVPCSFDFSVFEPNPKEDEGRARSCEEFSSGGLIPSWASDFIEDGGTLVKGVDLRGMVPMFPGREPPIPPKVDTKHEQKATVHPQVSRLWGWLDPKSTAKGPAFQPEEFLKKRQTEDILAAADEFTDAWLKSGCRIPSMSSSTFSLTSQRYASSGYDSQSEPASPEAGYQFIRGSPRTPWTGGGSVPSSGYASRYNSEPPSPNAGYQLSRGSPGTPWTGAGSVTSSGYASRYNSEPSSPEAGYQFIRGSPRIPWTGAGSVPSSGYASRYNSEPSSPEAGYQFSRGSPRTGAGSVPSSGYASRCHSEPSSPEAGYQFNRESQGTPRTGAAPFPNSGYASRYNSEPPSPTADCKMYRNALLSPSNTTQPVLTNEIKMQPLKAPTIAECFRFNESSLPTLKTRLVNSGLVQIPKDAANPSWKSMDENDPMCPTPYPGVEVRERDQAAQIKETKVTVSKFVGKYGGACVARTVVPITDYRLFSKFVPMSGCSDGIRSPSLTKSETKFKGSIKR